MKLYNTPKIATRIISAEVNQKYFISTGEKIFYIAGNIFQAPASRSGPALDLAFRPHQSLRLVGTGF